MVGSWFLCWVPSIVELELDAVPVEVRINRVTKINRVVHFPASSPRFVCLLQNLQATASILVCAAASFFCVEMVRG
jgi:hypothetical protein